MIATKVNRTAIAATANIAANAARYENKSRYSSASGGVPSGTEVCKPVPHAVDVFDWVLQRANRAQFAAKIGNVRLDGVASAVVVEGRYFFAQQPAAENLQWAVHQGFKDGVFAARERHLPVVIRHDTAARIEAKTAALQDGLSHVALATRHRPNSRRELGQVEGLYNVVVGAGIERANFVAHVVARRNHQNESFGFLGAQTPAEFDAVESR